jgi:hypothetical protein
MPVAEIRRSHSLRNFCNIVVRGTGLVGLSSRPDTDCERALVGSAHFQRERHGALLRVHAVVCAKVLDAADIVRDAIFL